MTRERGRLDKLSRDQRMRKAARNARRNRKPEAIKWEKGHVVKMDAGHAAQIPPDVRLSRNTILGKLFGNTINRGLAGTAKQGMSTTSGKEIGSSESDSEDASHAENAVSGGQS